MIKKTLIASLLISTLGVAYSIEVSNTHVSSYLEEPLRLEADLKGIGEIKLAAPTEYLKFNHPVLNYDVSLQVVGEGENRRLVLSSTESIDDPSVVILLEAKDANNNVQVFELPVLLDFKTGAPSVIEIDGEAPKTEAPKTDTKVADTKPKTDEKKPVDNKAKIDEPAKIETPPKVDPKAVATAKTKADELAKDKAAAQARLDASAKIEAQAKLDTKAQAEEKAKVAAQTKVDAKAEEKAKIAAQAKVDAKAQAEEKAKVAAQAKLDAKAQTEEKAKVAAQAKLEAKAQAQEKAKIAAQAKVDAKAQAQEKVKVAAQAKVDAKAQAEEKAKSAAQAKLDERAALDARVKAEAKARLEANTQTQTASVPVASASPSASHYGPVKDGETLWAIANKVKPSSVSTQQMLEALRKQNPRAFSQGVLLKGATLAVPDLLNSNVTPVQNESSIIKTEHIESPEMVNNKIEEIIIGIIYKLPPIPETKAPPVAVEPPPAVVEPPPAVIEPPPVVVEPPPAVVEPPPAVVEPPPVAVEPPPVVKTPPVIKTPVAQVEDKGIVGLLIDNIVYVGMAFFAVIMGLLALVFARHRKEEKRIDDELNQLNKEFSMEGEHFIEESSFVEEVLSDAPSIEEPIEEFDFDALDEIIAEDDFSASDDLSEETHEINEQDIFLSEKLEALKSAPKKDYTEDNIVDLAFDLETLTTDLTPSGAKIEKTAPQDDDVSGFVESMTDLEASLKDERQEFTFDSIEKISEVEPSEVTAAPSSEEHIYEEATDIDLPQTSDLSEDHESVQVKLDLAEAYMKIDKSLALPLLEEVIRDGSSEQIKQAERLKTEEPSADIPEAMDSPEVFEITDAIDVPEEITLPESINLPKEIDFPDADELFGEVIFAEPIEISDPIDIPKEIDRSELVLPEEVPLPEEIVPPEEIIEVVSEEPHQDYESERIKLELAEAYLNFDVTLAKPLLVEVLRDGNPEQIAKAQAMFDKL